MILRATVVAAYTVAAMRDIEAERQARAEIDRCKGALMEELDLHKMARKALVDASVMVYGAPAEDGPRYLFTTKALESFHRQAVLAERERCACVCEAEKLEDPADTADDIAYNNAVRDCAAAIRSDSKLAATPQ